MNSGQTKPDAEWTFAWSVPVSLKVSMSVVCAKAGVATNRMLERPINRDLVRFEINVRIDSVPVVHEESQHSIDWRRAVVKPNDLELVSLHQHHLIRRGGQGILQEWWGDRLAKGVQFEAAAAGG